MAPGWLAKFCFLNELWLKECSLSNESLGHTLVLCDFSLYALVYNKSFEKKIKRKCLV